jgi:hypothetical protein
LFWSSATLSRSVEWGCFFKSQILIFFLSLILVRY